MTGWRCPAAAPTQSATSRRCLATLTGLAVSVLEGGHRPARRCWSCRPANAASAAGFVAGRPGRCARCPRCGSERSGLGPVHSVHTTFVAESPDRLSIDVKGGAARASSARTAGLHGRCLGRAVDQPGVGADPFWAPGATAAYVSGERRRTASRSRWCCPGADVLPAADRPRATHLVTQLHMVTAAHFMQEHAWTRTGPGRCCRPTS